MPQDIKTPTLDPVTLEVLRTRSSHRRRDGGADPPHLPLLRDLRPGLLLGAVRRRRQHRHAGQPGYRRARGHAALHRQGRIEAFPRHAPRATSSRSTTRISAVPISATCGSCVRFSPMDELIGFSQSNGHWADIGGSVPGSSMSTPRSTSAKACGSRRSGSSTADGTAATWCG